MARQSREAQQDAALVQLLRALPEQRLEGVLEGVGVLVTDEARPRLDKRRCRRCGHGYVGCRQIAEKGDPHEWDPIPPSRSDA